MFNRTFQWLLVGCLVTGSVWGANDPFVGKWKVDPSRSTLNDEMKVEVAARNLCYHAGPTMIFFLERPPMSNTRREVLFLLSGLVSSAAELEGLPNQGLSNQGMSNQALSKQDNSLPSATYGFSELPMSNANGAEIRPVLKGKLATSESLEVHETTIPPGAMPHPAHHHVHSEMWLIREGTVQLTINGTSHVMGPGSVGFVHSNDEHGIKNVGTTPATYFVVAVGPGADA